MVENPLPFIPELAEEKVERVSVHYEIPGGPEKALRAFALFWTVSAVGL